jgi:CMP-N-acetylneuraminate monooxygenase
VYHGGFWRLLQAPYYRRRPGILPVPLAQRIAAENSIGQIIERFKEPAERIFRRYGLYCGACSRASAESIAQGAAAHGIDTGQITRLVEELNSAFCFSIEPLRVAAGST